MNKKILQTDADLQNSIYFQWEVEVWIGREFEMICMISGYDENVIKVVGGGFYLRENVLLKIN
ncbi:hypothetical protein [Paenibacillus lutimineralis]|uniref:Uncharacterized protein n=1 Tax=Paenibacillus lutimineralis TaxID=2707005 RepID=A0A3Q9I7B3_9BACL|nr:hypothetical protein [Paenibacillus lutimineralis]AZS14328.1 hypothetical protein EI981_07560 [Paenibacillus lutimineralis]